jgi:hypothetical protein
LRVICAVLIVPTVAKQRQRSHGTRRVEPTPPEQQDRLAEQLSPGGGDSKGAAVEAVEHDQHGLDGEDVVVGGTRPGGDGYWRNVLVESLAALSDKDPEADEQGLARSRRRGDHRPVAVENSEVEVTLSHADDPLANRGPGHVVIASHLRQGDPLGHLRRRAEDVAHVIGFARQHVAGQNSLTGVACPATSQPHQNLRERRGGIQAACHPAVGQVQVIARTLGANAPRQNPVCRTRHDFLILGRLNRKYVRQHVPRRLRLVGMSPEPSLSSHGMEANSSFALEIRQR